MNREDSSGQNRRMVWDESLRGFRQEMPDAGAEKMREEKGRAASTRAERRAYQRVYRKRHRHIGSKIVLWLIILLILAVLTGAYLAVGSYYKTRFFPGTYINGLDCSGLTVQEVEYRIANEAEDYGITIKERDGVTEQIDGAYMGYVYLSDGSVQDVKNAQDPMLWLNAYFHPETYSSNVVTSYDKEMLREAVLGLDCFDEEKVTAPQDACIVQKDDGSYELQSEIEGNQLDSEKVISLIQNAVDAGETEVDLEAADCYLKPAVRSDDEALNTRYAVLKKYESMTVTYLIGDEREVLDTSTIFSWMTIGEDGSVSFDWNQAADWLAALGDRYDTIGNQVPFTTSLGETVTVETVTYGWKIDEANEINELLAVLEAGESVEKEPLYLETARTHSGNGIGSTYVEIDYASQRMWFYKDGQLLVDTYVVTGNVSAGNGSPTGIYCIYNKELNATLKGEDYETPVNYWMPFYGGVGIHDATWRSSFGGDIYLTSGSHGCINTPLDQVKIIYENISIGDPVICYNGSGSGSGSTTVSGDAAQSQSTGTTDDGVIVIEDSAGDSSGWSEQEWDGYVAEDGTVIEQ